MKISVALATFNEEENISECLKTVENWVNEIVIVDGSSTDKTVEIAKKYKAKVILADNPPIFHINKQKAIKACKSDWILQLDADERVTEELKNEILSIIKNPASLDGYFIPRKNWFLGRFLKKGGQYPDYTLRLYRRGKAYLPCKSVHEQAVVRGEVGYLKNDLIHYADPNFSRYLKRWSRYTDLIAQELNQEFLGKGIIFKLCEAVNYLIIKPIRWFFLTYIRHKGFMDSWQGFVFSFFSALRFPTAFFKFARRI